ncbi:PAS domain-containing protein [Sphingomonas montana]|uniref:PAS domain-containing protein n=1 Tax=Sphingomonas montana TaxID=1843236 RepID=UPI0009F83F41|nr:PAS domain-containing protein [Sphingomonas montana]
MLELDGMMKRQRVLAAFGEFAIHSEDLDAVLMEACRLVGEATRTGRAKVIEIQEDRRELLVRAGVGWAPDVVGTVRLQMGERSSETYAIKAARPIVSQDIAQDDRFDVPPFMKEAGVVALVNVPIFVPGQRPYGVLQIDDTKAREFGDDEIEFLRTYAMILGPVIDRLHLVTEREQDREVIRASKARHSFLIASWAQAEWETDANGVVIADSPSWRAYTGQTVKEWLGYGWLDAIHPDDRTYAEKQWREATAAHGLVDAEFRLHAPDGGWRWTNVRAAPVLDADGDIVKWVGMNIDIDARKRAEAGLCKTEERLRTLMEGIPQLVWRAVSDGEWTWASPQWATYTGQTGSDSHGLGWLQALHPDDRKAAVDAWSHALKDGGFQVEYRICHVDDGQYRWFQTRATPVRDRSGEIVEWLGTSTDIHALRKLQERQQVLVAELQHRTRNLMAVVRSISDKTARASADIPDFRRRFRDRIEAMSRVQGLLSRLNDHDRVTFDELIKAELAAVNGSVERVMLSGPAGIRLRSSTVQTLAMALHELATNAVKYGALGQPGGHLHITWWVDEFGEGRKPWLHIDWRESGVVMPSLGSAPCGTGQGRELIEKALPYQLRAKTSYVFGPDGVHCTISLLVSASTEETSHARA